MTVEQLIEKLKTFDPALKVKSWDPEMGRFYEIEGTWDTELDNDEETIICTL